MRQEVERLLEKDADIDTIILACTHYPILYDKIRQYVPSHIRLLGQGEIVAESLADYLRRHQTMDARLSRIDSETTHSTVYLTTENSSKFSTMASLFLSHPIEAETVELI